MSARKQSGGLPTTAATVTTAVVTAVRRAVLLVAGDKAGNRQRWYDILSPSGRVYGGLGTSGLRHRGW
ncbi:hypothetical protein ACI2LV_23270 [Streptomyces fungicidicus]|uniref:hypothetical protein n=1 Tax=Streptomyces fungicidicus TaxID=68203 RepID=UPI0033CB51D7